MRRILLAGPHINGEGIGEPLTAFALIAAMAPLARLTVLSYAPRTSRPLEDQLPDCEVVTFRQPDWIASNRFVAMLKPAVPMFNREVAHWIAGQERRFDLAHQILPAAPRYPTPLRHAGIPYVVGSLGGALPTPPAFRDEVAGERWFTRLRAVDGLRLRHDPWLRASYSGADLVLGVAPYMREVLADVPMKRFVPFLSIGVDAVAPEVTRDPVPGRLRLLHVGRAVRTKGLRDTVRALVHLADLPGVTLTSIGGGEDLDACRAEAARLGVAERVVFLGALPRAEIEAHYRAADVFVFPSFRESMGGVLHEAMRWGLPVITVRVGGPDHIVDDASGLKVDLTTPETLPRDLAAAIRRLEADPALRTLLGQGARAKIEAEALWSVKAREMLGLYEQVIAAAGTRLPPVTRVEEQ